MTHLAIDVYPVVGPEPSPNANTACIRASRRHNSACRERDSIARCTTEALMVGDLDRAQALTVTYKAQLADVEYAWAVLRTTAQDAQRDDVTWGTGR